MFRAMMLILLGFVNPLHGSSTYIRPYQDILNRAEEKYGYNRKKDYFLVVNTTEQKMYLIYKKRLKEQYIISTAKAGEGSEMSSLKTPLGFLKIEDKIGEDAPSGTIFVAKQNTKKLSPIYTDKTDVEKDPVLTRIMHLSGLESHNKGGDNDSYKRGIFIHGTHEEGLLGEKASNGCIRMYNKDVIELYDTVPSGTIVYITQ